MGIIKYCTNKICAMRIGEGDTKRKVIIAYDDIRTSIFNYNIAALLGWQDIRQRYRRSVLGPFWLTISMGVMIGTIGIIFGQLFNVPNHEFIPFITVGMILWTFIVSAINEGCNSFTDAENIIRQLPLPLFLHILRTLWRNIIIFCHSIVIYPLVMFAFKKHLGLVSLFIIPSFILLLINITWIMLFSAIVCTRYRDMPQIVANILQIAFYITPIMWQPTAISSHISFYIFTFNPLYHLIEIVRAPLMGYSPSLLSLGISILVAIFGWGLALVMYGRYKNSIAYWL